MNDFIYWFENFSFIGVFKLLLVVLLIVYGLFAYMMMRQIGVMSRAIRMKDEYIVKVLGVAHFAFALLVLVVSVLVL